MYAQHIDGKAQDLLRQLSSVLRGFKRLDASLSHSPQVSVSLQELRVIEHLGEYGVSMMKEIAESLLVAVNTVTGIVDSLESKKLVNRLRSPSDRRVIYVELTESGRQVFEASLAEKAGFCQTLLSALDEDEQALCAELMRKIGRAARERAELVA
jgi:MarR family 2-MHQ and catechol resistance regulon transcriptional repressor